MKLKGLNICSFDPFDEFGLPKGTRYRQHNNSFISFSNLHINSALLKLYFKFNNSINDASGNGNNGTVTGTTTYTTGKLGGSTGAFSFNGSTYITSTVSPFNWDRTQAFSVVFWYNSSVANDTKSIIGNQQASSITGVGWGIWLQDHLSAQNFINFNITNTDSTNQLRVRTFPAVTLYDGLWHLVVVSYNGNSDVSGVKIFVDDVSVGLGTITNTLSASSVSTAALTVGSLPSDATHAITTTAQEFQIWNYALQQSDVDFLWNGGAGQQLT